MHVVNVEWQRERERPINTLFSIILVAMVTHLRQHEQSKETQITE